MNSIFEIILAIIAVIGNCGWFISGKKYHEEIRKAKAEAEKAELDLSLEYVNKFQENIQKPLEAELQKLRQSIERINRCRYRKQCPVARRLYQCEATQSSDSTRVGSVG